VADSSWLWAVFTLIAAAAQTVRNAAQRELTGKLGTVGATHVRFLFGCPFALVFLVAVLAAGAALPRPSLIFWPWLLDGALAQIAATTLMLAAMGERSFVVTIAYIKTEPVQVALFGLIFLGDTVTARMAAAILIATAGVIVVSAGGRRAPDQGGRPTLLPLSLAGEVGCKASGRGPVRAVKQAPSPTLPRERGRELHRRATSSIAGSRA
jgi:drug/metabolite transporter (DMT)-like permease